LGHIIHKDRPGQNTQASDGSLRSRWYGVFAATLALSLISAAASVTVVIYISRSLQNSVTTVDAQATMTIELGMALRGEVALVHQMIDTGAPAAEPFLDADRNTLALFDDARSMYDTEAEQSILGQIESEWDAVVEPYRDVAADPAAADGLAATAGADPVAKNELHFAIVAAEIHYQGLLDTLHGV
jgi:hypothetical protein